MPETLGELLEEQAGLITGRDDERARLRRLLEPDGPIVAYVHGLAGVGKSTRLHAFAADARAAGAATVELDGHVLYATQPRADHRQRHVHGHADLVEDPLQEPLHAGLVDCDAHVASGWWGEA
jgi:AAA ATPase-like protein